jgi:glutathione synthase/RimK-type ligase-like ATP-grasp enzyme
MTNILLRRKKLGKTSCEEIVANSGGLLQAIRNDEKIPAKVDFLFRWGCTSPADADHTINKAAAINLVSDKAASRRILDEADIPIPKTWLELRPRDIPPHGVIVRPRFHHQGRKLFFCKTNEEMQAAIKKCGDGAYISEFIPKDREWRIYVIQGRVALVAEKTVPDKKQIGWNKALGGTFHNVRWDNWPLEVCQEGIRSAKALGLDFGGIDIISLGKDNYVLEANAAPSLTSAYRQKVFAKCFKAIIEDGGLKEIPLPAKVKTYKGVIHPAVTVEG